MAEKFNWPNKSNEFKIQVTSEKKYVFFQLGMFGYACISIAKKPKHRQNRPEKYSDSLMQIWFTANTKSRLLYAMILFIYSAKTKDM